MGAFNNMLEPAQPRLGLLHSQDFEAIGGWRWAMVAAFILGKSPDAANQGGGFCFCFYSESWFSSIPLVTHFIICRYGLFFFTISLLGDWLFLIFGCF